MAIAMTSDLDFELAEMREAAIANSSKLDPIPIIEQLPEVSVPVDSLVPGFHLRHEGTDAGHVRLLADAAGSVKLPAILVQKRGSRIIDGMHRIEVAKLRGEWNISARIVDCTDSEALADSPAAAAAPVPRSGGSSPSGSGPGWKRPAEC